jgi:hypothetical protein
VTGLRRDTSPRHQDHQLDPRALRQDRLSLRNVLRVRVRTSTRRPAEPTCDETVRIHARIRRETAPPEPLRDSHHRVVRSPSARDAARPRRSASRDCTGRVADMSKVGVRPVCPDVFGPPRNRSTDATRGHRLPSADPGGSLRDAAGDPDPLGPELQRSVARDKVDLPTLRRTGVRWRRGGSSQPRGEDAPRHAPRKLSSGNYERVTNRAAVNTSDS